MKGVEMDAQPDDQIRVRGHRLGEPDRLGRVVEVWGRDGAPPFLVRWDDTGHVVLFFPGIDAAVDHLDDVGAER
jgi:hypothetical protein